MIIKEQNENKNTSTEKKKKSENTEDNMGNPKRWKPGTYIDNILDNLERDRTFIDVNITTSGLESSKSTLACITPSSTCSAKVEQDKFNSNIENDIVEVIFRHEDMILDEYGHLESEDYAFEFGSLKAGDNGTDYDDDVISSDLYASSTSDSESDNESKDVVDDRTSWQIDIKRRENKYGLPGRFKRLKRHKDSDDSYDSGSDESDSESDKVDTRLVAQNEITFNDDDSENSDSDSYDRNYSNNSNTISIFPHIGNNKKETGASKTGEHKSGLPGRFKRRKRHKDSDVGDVCSSEESDSESDKVDTCLIKQNEINSSDEDTENSDSDFYDKSDSNNSSTGSSFSHCGNYKKETSASETGDKLGYSSDMNKISDDSPTQPFEKLNTIINFDNDNYRWSELVSTNHTEQPDTDILDIYVNEDEDNFTDFSDSDYSDDEDSSENSSDEETEKVSTAGHKLPLIPRRMSVLSPLRMILLKYRTLRYAKKDCSSCCHLSCWTDWPFLKIISDMYDYDL